MFEFKISRKLIQILTVHYIALDRLMTDFIFYSEVAIELNLIY